MPSVHRHEHGIRWRRSVHVEAALACRADRGRDHVDLLASQVPSFAGMRIETAHRDAWTLDAELLLEVVRQDVQRLVEHFAGDRLRDRVQWNVGRGECDAQRVLARATDEQHHHARSVRALGEELGVPGKSVARIEQHALLRGCGDECIKRPCRAGIARSRECDPAPPSNPCARSCMQRRVLSKSTAPRDSRA